MKKWLGEASAPKNSQPPLEDDVSYLEKNSPANLLLPLNNERKLKFSPGSNSLAINMGLGVSSEIAPQNSSLNSQSQEELVSSHRCSGELSLHRPSVAFITSVNSRIQVSSPCHHFSSPTVSVQLHPASTYASSAQNQRLMSILSPGVNSIAVESPATHQPSCSSLSHYHALGNEVNSLNSAESSLIHNITNQGLSLPSSTFQIPSEGDLTHATCSSDGAHHSISSHLHISSICGDSSSESESRPESSAGSCNSGLYSAQQASSGSDYDNSTHVPMTSNSQVFHQSSTHLSGSAALASGGIGSAPGCGHWCSACRVRVQVEVECVPSSQRSPSGNRRGIRTLTLPKKTRPRHKIKAPSKELTSNHKKKKSPWPFRLNCRLRTSKTEEEESTLSSLNMGCASCVCPGYRRPESEPTYRSVVESGSTNNLNIHAPMVDLSRFNPEAYPINDVEETARQERAREMAEGVEPPPGFRPIPILREGRNSLTLPLTYNMINLQVLLENSLRLGLGGSRTSGVSYQGESLMHQIGTLSSDGSYMSRGVHTQVDYIHCLVPDLLAVTNCGFYWGKMDRYEAERLLENRPEGTFLLRDSAQEEYLFSVSFRRYGRSLHARIEQWNHKFSFDSHDPGVFASDTVCGLIEHYKDPSCCMYFEPLLTNPLARTFPFPLQHLCRATICSKTTYDGISNLDLPKTLKNYLKEYHYKQRVRVRHLD